MKVNDDLRRALECFHADDECVIDNRHTAKFGVTLFAGQKDLRYGSMTIVVRQVGTPFDMPELIEPYALDRAVHYNKVMPRKRRAQ